MRLVVVTFSPTGGTRKAAKLLAESWNCQRTEVDLLRPVPTHHRILLTKEDLCIAAMPVYGGRIPAEAAKRMDCLSGNGAAAVAAVVYGNRAADDALPEMRDLLKLHGFRIVAGVEAIAEHSIVRQYGAGRPDAKDAEVLFSFSQQIAEKAAMPEWEEAQITGAPPYRTWKGGPQPLTGSDCRYCGLCAEECPVGAITMKNGTVTTDAGCCISCMRCISVCPAGARELPPAVTESLGKRLAPICTVRKENRLYL